MKLNQRIFKEKVLIAIQDLKDVSTPQLMAQLTAMERNLATLKSLQTKIVSLAEHRKIKLNFLILTEVIRDRKGDVMPIESIETKKPRKAKPRTGTIKLYK